MQQQQQSSTALASSDGSNNTALKAKEQPKMVQVRFWLKFHVDYGQTIRIIGGHDQMGERAASRPPCYSTLPSDHGVSCCGLLASSMRPACIHTGHAH